MQTAEAILGALIAGVGLTAMVVIVPFVPIWLAGILLTIGFVAFSAGRTIALRGILEAKTGFRSVLERLCLDAGFFAVVLTAIVLGPATAAVGMARGSALATFGGIVVQWLMIFLAVYMGLELIWAGALIVKKGITATEAAIESAKLWRARTGAAAKSWIMVAVTYAAIFTVGGLLAQFAPANLAPWLFAAVSSVAALAGEYVYGALAMRELFKE